MDPRLDFGGRHSCCAAVATRSVSIAVRAAHLNHRRQSRTDAARPASYVAHGASWEPAMSAATEIMFMGAGIFAIPGPF
jgi:hypothetical protein